MAEEKYALSRGNAEADRLNQQHIWLKNFDAGDILHKSIPTQRFKDKKVITVADIATGTGIWLLDFASHFDNDNGSEFVGFDISTSQLNLEAQPSPAMQHKKIEWVVHDMFEPFPEKYHNHFDLIHVRLVVCAVAKSAVSKLLRNLRQILKPGGYLAWHEADYADFIAQPPHPVALATYQRIEKIVAAYNGSTALPSDVLATIVSESQPVNSSLTAKTKEVPGGPSPPLSSDESSDEHLRLVAFERTSSEVFDHSARQTGHINLCLVWSNAIRKAIEKRQEELNSEVDGARLEELRRGISADRKLADDLERAAYDGSFQWDLAFTWIVARKYPLANAPYVGSIDTE